MDEVEERFVSQKDEQNDGRSIVFAPGTALTLGSADVLDPPAKAATGESTAELGLIIAGEKTETCGPGPRKLCSKRNDSHEKTEPIDDEGVPVRLTKTTSGPDVAYSIYSRGEKWAIVALLATAGIFSPMSANIFFPSIPNVASNLRTTVEQINVSVTIYMISQGVSPTIWGSMCDVTGRRPVILVTFFIYVGSCAGLSQTHAYWLLVLLRFIQAAGSSSVNSIGGGIIGDIAPPSERGGFMAVYSLGSMLGPCIGPVIGGLFAETQSWQSMFVFLSAFGGLVTILLILFLPETLRTIVGNGSIPPKGINRSPLYSYLQYRHQKKGTVIFRSEKREQAKSWRQINLLSSFQIILEKDAFMILIFISLCYTLFYSILTSMAALLKDNYQLSEIDIGLCFLGFGGGCMVSAVINTRRLDYDFRVVAKKYNYAVASKKDLNDLSEFPIEEARLRSVPYTFAALTVSMIIYGWAIDKRINLALPLICTFFVGITSTMQMISFSTLLVDDFPRRSAAAIGAFNFSRCLIGAGGVALFDPLLRAVGPGWMYTMLPLIVWLFFPFWYILIHYGKSMRAQRKLRDDRRELDKTRKEALSPV